MFNGNNLPHELLLTTRRKTKIRNAFNNNTSTNFSNTLAKSIATTFVFYCNAKHSDTLLGSSQACCYLFLGGCGQKWA